MPLPRSRRDAAGRPAFAATGQDGQLLAWRWPGSALPARPSACGCDVPHLRPLSPTCRASQNRHPPPLASVFLTAPLRLWASVSLTAPLCLWASVSLTAATTSLMQDTSPLGDGRGCRGQVRRTGTRLTGPRRLLSRGAFTARKHVGSRLSSATLTSGPSVLHRPSPVSWRRRAELQPSARRPGNCHHVGAQLAPGVWFVPRRAVPFPRGPTVCAPR